MSITARHKQRSLREHYVCLRKAHQRAHPQLSLAVGDKIHVYSTSENETGDVGWWFGAIGPRYGLFPINFTDCGTSDGSSAEGSTSPISLKSNVKLHQIDETSLNRLDCIGRGGFAQVYHGEYTTGTGLLEVAIKALEISHLSNADREIKVQELLAEGELLAACSHKNICKIFGVVCCPDENSLVMEFARGGSLSTALKAIAADDCMTLGPSVVLDWATQIARGMNYLHNEAQIGAVVHRDLKSANILLSKTNPDGGLLTDGNTLKICDFGLAREFELTVQMTAAGTYAWMAPEVIRTCTVSKSSDVWSFGVLLWELLTCQVCYLVVVVASKLTTLPLKSVSTYFLLRTFFSFLLTIFMYDL